MKNTISAFLKGSYSHLFFMLIKLK